MIFHFSMTTRCEARRCVESIVFEWCVGIRFVKCTSHLTTEGLCGSRTGRLTNIRYVDELMNPATSQINLEFMIESLIIELRGVGLDMNAAKTKLLRTSTSERHLIQIGDHAREVLDGDTCPK